MSKPKPSAGPSVRTEDDSLFDQLTANRFGYRGFQLSLAQLVVHGIWIAFVSWLTASGQAAGLEADSWQLWLVTLLILAGASLTMISLFVCLRGILAGPPRVLALLGFSLSFFLGAFTTFALLLNALAKH